MNKMTEPKLYNEYERPHADLREFIAQLESRSELCRVAVEIDPRLEMTELCDRVLKRSGPALLFERSKGSSLPVLGNLFGTPKRVALGMVRPLADTEVCGHARARNAASPGVVQGFGSRRVPPVG